jgi:hypothetical protein
MEVSISIQKRIARWLDPASYFALETMPRDFAKIIERIHEDKDQIMFLLNQAPMMDMIPVDRAAVACAPFAYVHPKTLAKASGNAACTLNHGRQYFVFLGSPTKWIVTSWMPEGRVIFTPNPMPGIEKILAA